MAATRLPAGSTTSRSSSRVGTSDDLRGAMAAAGGRRISTSDDLRAAMAAGGGSQPVRRRSIVVVADEKPQVPVHERFSVATLRFERITEVNGKLHGALVKRRMTALEVKAELESLEQRIDSCRTVEEPARVAGLEALELEITLEQQRLQESSLELGRGIMDLDERVAGLSAGNAATREASTRRRAMLKEQQSELRAQQRAVKNLSRHIQIMEEGTDYDQLAGWSLSDARMPDSQTLDAEVLDEEMPGAVVGPPPVVERGASTRSPEGAKRGASILSAQQQPQTIEDYRKLPGLDLQLLLGGRASPLV